MKTYRARRSTLVFTLGFLALLTGLTIFGVFYAEPQLFFVAFLLVLGWRWHQILKSPVAVSLGDDGVVEFRSMIGRLKMSVDQIKGITRVGRGYYLEHEGGSLNLYGNMEGIEDLLARLESLNPALKVKPFTWGQKS